MPNVFLQDVDERILVSPTELSDSFLTLAPDPVENGNEPVTPARIKQMQKKRERDKQSILG